MSVRVAPFIVTTQKRLPPKSGESRFVRVPETAVGMLFVNGTSACQQAPQQCVLGRVGRPPQSHTQTHLYGDRPARQTYSMES